MRLPGRATPDGTAAYAKDQTHQGVPPRHFRQAGGLTVSSIGHGSYLGTTGEEANQAYEDAALACLQGGVNVLDTASNYRDQRSERDVGRALQRYVQGGGDRSHVLVATKAGFLHGDADSGMRGPDWFNQQYVLDGTVGPTDIAANVHCMTPAYLGGELDRSRDNLALDTIDVFFVHNPESQLADVGHDEFYGRIRDAFTYLERRAESGDIKVYGVATWDGLRAPPADPAHVSLVKLVHEAGEAAVAVGKKASAHRFRAVELPVNLAMTEAIQHTSQPWRMAHMSALEAAQESGMLTFASASMMQGRLVGQVPDEWVQALEAESQLEACMQFTRGVKGVHTALVGMGRPEHAREVLEWCRTPPREAEVRTMMGSGYGHD